MEVKVTENTDVTLLEILKDGNPVNPQNPVTITELESLDMPEVRGGSAAIVSGMPVWAIVTVALKVKNLFGAIAVYDPKSGGGVVVHTTTPKHKVGTVLPLG
jgi:hypothetical protein